MGSVLLTVGVVVGYALMGFVTVWVSARIGGSWQTEDYSPVTPFVLWPLVAVFGVGVLVYKAIEIPAKALDSDAASRKERREQLNMAERRELERYRAQAIAELDDVTTPEGSP